MKTCPLCDKSWPSHHTSCPTDGATLIDSRELDPGTIIRGKYRIQRLLGRGGMGAVYLAEHILLARPRALKFISGDLTQDPAFLRRFRREALAAIELRHPNVVEVVDLDQAEDGSPYIAMEFVDGPDLRHVLDASYPPNDRHPEQKNDCPPERSAENTTVILSERSESKDLRLHFDSKPALCQGTTSVVPISPQNESGVLTPARCFPIPRALHIARGIAQGLAAAHAKGIIHRDVKPENILLANPNTAAETPKLLDFGIAAVHETVTAVSRTRGLMLTPPYASPEQWRGLPADQLDGRADLYALGGVLYEMLTGQTPFHAHNSEGWMFQHLQEQPQPPSHLRPELANWQGLDALVLSLLAKDREDRPKDAAELVGLLDAVRHLPPEAHQETVRDVKATNATQASAENRPKPATRSGSRWALAAVLMLLVALLILKLYTTGVAPSAPTDRPQFDPTTGNPTAAKPKVYLDPSKGEPIDSPIEKKPWDQYIDTAATEKNAEVLFKQKHYSDARHLFEETCNGGEMRACSYLGYLYAKGLGGERDLEKARAVYQKACDQGILSSCASLGTLYQDAGNGEEASKYFQKACSGGVAEACELLRGVQ